MGLQCCDGLGKELILPVFWPNYCLSKLGPIVLSFTNSADISYWKNELDRRRFVELHEWMLAIPVSLLIFRGSRVPEYM
jgi:hypothetical protein